MTIRIMELTKLPLFLFLVLQLILLIPKSCAQIEFLYEICGGNYTTPSPYENNLNTALNSMSLDTRINYGYYNFTAGYEPDKVEAMALCRSDISIDACRLCVWNSAATLPTICRNNKQAFGFSEYCLLYYTNTSAFHTLTDAPYYDLIFNGNVTNMPKFNNSLISLITNLKNKASLGNSETKFATGKVNVTSNSSLYGLVQCSPDLSRTDCVECVESLVDSVYSSDFVTLTNGSLFMAKGARVVAPSCNIRYELYSFYGNVTYGAQPPAQTPSLSPNKNIDPTTITRSSKKKKTSVIVGVTISSVLASLILLGACVFASKRRSIVSFDEVDVIEEVESLRFGLSKIRKATNNFSADNKLGQGGFGEVYKGTLENGECIAIKRLSSNSKQGISQFKTEVVLVAKLQHRNLVKLLGFCLSKKEKILVYEFLPNMSLDRFLLDPMKRASLNWSTRFKIIRGIARGLLYLHEDSRLKIVHRDLKPSNILLDEHMNPKIADFGIAKLFGIDQTQDNTDRIVGTLGYMAPEYLIAGHFSVKSDVYGFGIIVLELVSGQKNKYSRQVEQEDDESLFLQAWRLWNEGMPLKLADPTFKGDFPIEELAKCIHIGLLCIQDDKARRPQMVSIVALLNGESISLPFPTPPSFMACHVNNKYEDGYSHPTCSSISIDVR